VLRRLKVTRKLLAVMMIVIVAASLVAWTILSPVEMQVQSHEQLSSSILQYARSVDRIAVRDGGGSYEFELGLDYNSNETSHQPFAIIVYAFLVSENITSPFVRGVGLSLQGSTVLVDGIEDHTVKVRSTYSPQVASFFLTFVEVNSTGLHKLAARLILNTVDLNYIGYMAGTTDIVSLNGSIAVL
jgi:hypothetical protein